MWIRRIVLGAAVISVSACGGKGLDRAKLPALSALPDLAALPDLPDLPALPDLADLTRLVRPEQPGRLHAAFDDPPRPSPARGPATPEPGPHEAPECAPPEALDVLFIGNSFTKNYDLPGLVERLGQHAGIELNAGMLAVPGTDFEFHAQRTKTARVLASGDWDVVVLQSHSLDPLRDPDGFFDAGETLVAMVREVEAAPILFETWARKSGHRLYARGGFPYRGPDAMHQAVQQSYQRLAKLTHTDVVEVGRAWRSVRAAAPDLDPYADDAYHQAELGAYLTANVFFAALTDVTPVGNVGPLLGIDPTAALVLQAEAANVVRPPC